MHVLLTKCIEQLVNKLTINTLFIKIHFIGVGRASHCSPFPQLLSWQEVIVIQIKLKRNEMLDQKSDNKNPTLIK